VNLSAQALRELRGRTAGSYASPPASKSAQALRDLDASVAGQYGIRPATDATVNPRVHALRGFQRSVARHYGPPR
jgi:hypothetical protein